MHLQNRVTPFGEIVSISQRGTLIGNRGIIHDPATKTLLRRRWTTKTRLVCSCEYKGRAEQLRHADGLLTPPSTLMALGAGYRPALHPSIN